MRHNKFYSVAMALLLIAFFTTSWVSPTPTPHKTWVSITGVYDFVTFPNTVGTFTTSGALTLSGTSTMDVSPNVNGRIAHCVVTLYPSGGEGTITIHQECEFATSPSKGQWQIVSGTGAYANLKGNGSLLMPPMVGSLGTEAMTGVIY